MYYSNFGILAIIIHIIINIDVLKKTEATGNFPARASYRRFLYSVLVYYASDAVWGILFEQKLVTLVYIDTVVYFASMVLSVLLWTRFVVRFMDRDSVISRALLMISGWVIMAFETVALAVNLFFPILFYFDAEGGYHPLFARYITLGIQVLLFFLSAVYALIVSRKVPERKLHYIMIGCSGIVMTVFIILQTLYPLLPLYAVGSLLATCLVHTFILQDSKAEYNKRLGAANVMAYKDALTGVRNKHAYTEMISSINSRIRSGELSEFAVIVFDLNWLKETNDTRGHDTGDRYLRDATQLICSYFKRSPVFRIGGDEFTAILEGADYQDRNRLFAEFNAKACGGREPGSISVSSGMAVYDPREDKCFEDVFKRSDKLMYARKKEMKAGR